MGQAVLPATEECDEKIYTVDLYDRKEKSQKRPGKLTIQITSSRNLQLL